MQWTQRAPMLPLLAATAFACGGLARTTHAAAYQSKSSGPKSAKGKAASKKKAPAPAGGANQVEGLRGKVGDMLFTGRWRFQVQDVQTVDTYTLKVPTSEQDYGKYRDTADYDTATHTFKPKEGFTFVAVKALEDDEKLISILHIESDAVVLERDLPTIN